MNHILLSGNEAVALVARDADVILGTGYPDTFQGKVVRG